MGGSTLSFQLRIEAGKQGEFEIIICQNDEILKG
jgi:hypothetical protein